MAGAGGFRRPPTWGALRALQVSTLAAIPCPCSGPATYTPNVTFVAGQDGCGEQRIGPLVIKHQARKRLYYGLEILCRTRKDPVILDFNRFLPVLPVFVSVVWHSLLFFNVEPIGQVDALVLSKHLASKIPVVPHFTAYCLTKERMDEFLALNFTNLLALRGDDVDPNQEFKLALSIVEQAKCRKGDKISVAVAGFPEGYTSHQGGPVDLKKNIMFLKAKVDAGADCIITQTCYRPEAIVQFVKDCRAVGIQVPILMGIMPHDTFNAYSKMDIKGGVKLPPDLLKDLEELKCQIEAEPNKDPDLICKFFVRLNVRIICQVLAADVDIWGIVFFSLNKFGSVEATLKELYDLDLLKK